MINQEGEYTKLALHVKYNQLLTIIYVMQIMQLMH